MKQATTVLRPMYLPVERQHNCVTRRIPKGIREWLASFQAGGVTVLTVPRTTLLQQGPVESPLQAFCPCSSSWHPVLSGGFRFKTELPASL